MHLIKKNNDHLITLKFHKIKKQQIFTISFIILSAKLAKSDGQVTNDENPSL